MRKLLFASLMAVMLLAACSSTPTPGGWCYIYNFQDPAIASRATLTYGYVEPGWGLSTEIGYLNTDRLSFNITETFEVYPTQLVVTIARGSYAPAPADILIRGIQGQIFGADPSPLGNFLQLSAGRGSDVLVASGIGGETVHSNSIDLSFSTDVFGFGNDALGHLYISNIQVFGEGISPYGQNDCDPDADTATPADVTPSTSTPAPTLTPEPPTVTPTGTRTPTSEPTNPPYYCESEFDFSVSDWDWEPGAPAPISPFPGWDLTPKWGNYGSGGWNGEAAQIGALGNDLLGALAIKWTYTGVPMSVTGVEWTYTKSSGTYLGTMQEQIVIDGYSPRNISSDGLGSGTYFISVNPAGWSLATGEIIEYYHPYHRDWSAPFTSAGSFKLTRFVVSGTCVPPTFTPTSTFTPSNTPTNTATFTPSNTNTPLPLSVTPSSSPTVFVTGTRTPTRTPIVMATWTPRPTQTDLPSSTPFPTWTLTWTQTSIPPSLPPPPSHTPVTYTPEFSYTPIPGNTGTPFGTPFGTPWGTPDEWGEPWGTQNATSIGEATGLPELALTPQFGPVHSFLSTAVVQVNGLPSDITAYVPSVDAGELFGYVKWAISCSSVAELTGQTLSPFFCHAMVGVSANVFIAGVLIAFRIIRLFLSMALMVVKKISGRG